MNQDEQDKALARFEALEIRMAHQDRTIDDLNTAVRDQWERIDRLTKQIERMVDRLQRVEDSGPPDGSEPPPPHY
ncbi:MAG: SlyX family protein [Alphaproteobacteria bacterium]